MKAPTPAGALRTEDAVNELLRVLLSDRDGGRTRSTQEYRDLFPGFEELVERELQRLAGGPCAENARFGPYELLEELGRGAQGRVFRARDTRLGRIVALKTMNAVAGLSAAGRTRFGREAEIVSRLEHPGICTVYEAGEHEGVPFIAMRFLAGETLARVLARDRKPPATPAELERVFSWIEEAARAVHLAHTAGIVHRDIKPGNLMITADGHAVLLDFGVAYEVEAHTLTLSDGLFGTPAYMAPEQIAGSARLLDHQVDVYALGVTLYEGLTRQLPFQSESRATLFRAILTRPAADPRRINPALPRDARAVVEKALEKEPRRRYATALELAEELARLRRGEPVRARAITRPERLWRWARREPVKAALTSAAALVLILGTLLGANWSGILEARESDRLARKQAQLDRGFDQLAHGDLRIAESMFDETLSGPEVTPQALAGKVICLAYTNRLEEANRLLAQHRTTVERYPDLEWLELHIALGETVNQTEMTRDLFRRIEARRSPLGLFVAALANENGLSFDVTNLGRSSEFMVYTLVTSKHARTLLHQSGDYARSRAEAKIVTGDLARHLLFAIRATDPGDCLTRWGKGCGCAGDVDGDGHDDFLASFSRGAGGNDSAPLVRVYSGRDGSILRTIAPVPFPDGSEPFDATSALFGGGVAEPCAVELVPDIDGDGSSDHVFAWRNPSPGWAAFSGRSGMELWRHPSGGQCWGISPLGDLDGDGTVELLGGSGVYSSRTGELLCDLSGFDPGRLSAVGDVDGDGHPEIAGSSSYEHLHGLNSGRVTLHSFWRHGQLAVPEPVRLYEITGRALFDQLGMFAGELGDIDGDRRSEFFASEHWASDRGFQTGRVRVFSGADGSEVYELNGDEPLGKFGASVRLVGDLDRDGHRDLGVASTRSNRNGPYSGSITVFSAKDGKRLLTLDGPAPNAGLGHCLADAGDVNADGVPDLVCGSFYPGDSQELGDLTSMDLISVVYVFSGRPLE